MLELYRAYADYQDLMEMVEAMLKGMSQAVLGTTSVPYQDETVDLAKPFTRLTMEEAIVVANPQIDRQRLRDRAYLATYADGVGVQVRENYGSGKLQTEIFDKTCEDGLRQPTFITAYPTEVSPLSRRNDNDEFVTDRFELFVTGREMANGFSELNDPEDQADRFRAQAESREAGDDEAMVFDADYIRALEYGMPPTAGLGVGIDRLVMLFTNAASIRDVLLFPHMRPEVFD
jgi:lysyl-tRNA synthetase class 2